nr:hypothetical protein PBI_RACECAR_127 [Arthrobacter phage Racecar]
MKNGNVKYFLAISKSWLVLPPRKPPKLFRENAPHYLMPFPHLSTPSHALRAMQFL